MTLNSSLRILNVNFEAISDSELYDLNKSLISDNIQATLEVVNARSEILGLIKLNPIVKDGSAYKKLFRLLIV